MRIWLEVETAAGVRTGRIDNLLYWRNLPRLSKAGSIEFAIPAGDAKAALLVNKRRVACYGVVAGAVTELGRGIVEEIETQWTAGAAPILVYRGGDILRELAIHSTLSTSPNVPVEFDDVNNAPSTIITTFAGVGRMPAAWSLGGASTTGTNIYLRSWHDSVLSILIAIADVTGEQFRPGTGRQLYWLGPASGFASSGVLATSHGDPAAIEGNANTCLITKITKLSDSWDQWNRIYLFGSGEAEARLDLRAVTTWPAGFVDTTSAGTTMTFTSNVATAAYGGETWTVDRAQGYLENTTRATADGYLMRALPVKNIAPLSNTDADLADAANMLLKAGYNWVRTRTTAQSFYKLSITALDALLLPGQTLQVAARGMYEDEDGKRLWLDIDGELIVLEPEQEITERGIRTVGLTVATTDRWPDSDESAVIAPLQQSIVMQALPQIGPNLDTINYGPEDMDIANDAAIRFRLSNAVTTVNSMVLWFRVDPLRSTLMEHDDFTDVGHSHTWPIYEDTISTSIGLDSLGTIARGGSGRAVANNIATSTGGYHWHHHRFGIVEETAGNTIDYSELTIEINGGSPTNSVSSEGNGWYSLDITPDVSDTTTGRPDQEQNTVTFSDGRSTVDIDTISKSGATVTVDTDSVHGLTTGDNVWIAGTSAYNGFFANVTVNTTTQFEFLTLSGSGTEMTGTVMKYKTARIQADIERRVTIQSVAIL